MRDDFQSAAWADHHHRLSDTLHDLFTATMRSMEVLTAQQFDAPWRAPQRRRAIARAKARSH